MGTSMERGQVWKRIEPFPDGSYDTVKVLAFVDGYVVARYKRCMPFLRSEKDWLKQFEWVGK